MGKIKQEGSLGSLDGYLFSCGGRGGAGAGEGDSDGRSCLMFLIGGGGGGGGFCWLICAPF